ncbi:hypothetical protein PG997_012569 [Apiospora hydei]|uniref:Uncharacterized protein n=1 Tax=Apiospora hydei TaxID=1337664 RepID=A0ABR1V3Q4_9PEZI
MPLPVPVDVSVNASVSAAGALVPAYATDVCLNVNDFSSACRCAGVRPTTITATAPSATLTVIKGAQVTETTQVDSTASLTTTATATATQTIVVTEMVSLTITVPLTSTVDQVSHVLLQSMPASYWYYPPTSHAYNASGETMLTDDDFPQTDTTTALATTTTEVLETTATVVTSTVTPAPSNGVLTVQGSRFDGTYARIVFPDDDNENASDHQAVRAFAAQSIEATLVSITDEGGLSVFGYEAASPNSRMAILFFEPSYRIQSGSLFALVCASAPVTGLVTCTRNLGGGPSPVVFQQCEALADQETNGAGVVISDHEEDGCETFEFVLEPQVSVN